MSLDKAASGLCSLGKQNMAFGSNACKLIKAQVEVDDSFTALNRDAALHGKEPTHHITARTTWDGKTGSSSGKLQISVQGPPDMRFRALCLILVFPAKPPGPCTTHMEDIIPIKGPQTVGSKASLKGVCDGLNSSPWRDDLIKTWKQDLQGL